MEAVFTTIYDNCSWGNNKSTYYNGSSGPGSSLANNERTYIPFLKKFITDNSIKRVVDLGCGDFICGPAIYQSLDVTYTGYDTYSKVIDYNIQQQQKEASKYNFVHLDFCAKKEEIIEGDLCILKDVIMHWPLKEIYTFLDYLVASKKFKYILICNCCDQTQHNPEISTGSWRPLSRDFLPLKRYNPTKLYNFQSNVRKEVSVITCFSKV